MKKFFLLIIISAGLDAAAQRVVDLSKPENINIIRQNFYIVGNEPFSNLQYVKVIEGTPFYSDNWMKGTVYFDDGTGYTGLYLKIDMLKGDIHFRAEDDKAMIIQAKLKGVVLTDTVTGNSHHFVNSAFWENNDINNGWYQLIVKGNASLYKLNRKIMRENKLYGSSTTEQQIETKPQYLLVYKQAAFPVKKWKEIPEILQDKKIEIADFIKRRDMEGKTDADYVNVVEYYNGL
ncbi:MAG: hypothetical protein H0V30_02620 [Chitinophagaceae bacterium]|jgi:tellurite resistance-related uncharacterized protein|nr:hypothetical protein [Chitinophagaceae bacterium]